MSGRTVPVAYVTKWATTAGIRVIRNTEETEDGDLYRHGTSARLTSLFVTRAHWTEDKVEAEGRYGGALTLALKSAKRKVAGLEAKLRTVPTYSEEP